MNLTDDTPGLDGHDDRDLRNRLGRISGPYPDANVALTAVRSRVRRAERRRAVAALVGSTATLLLLAVAFAATLTGRDAGSVRPAHSIEPAVPTTVTPTRVDAVPQGPATTTTTGASERRREDATGVAVAAGDGTGATASEPSATGTGPDQTSATGDTPAGTRPPASVRPGGDVRTIRGVGGSVTVRLDGDVAVVAATHPADGFDAQVVRRRGATVEVRLRSAHHSTRITAAVADGTLRGWATESEHDDGRPGDPRDPGDGDRNDGDRDGRDRDGRDHDGREWDGRTWDGDGSGRDPEDRGGEDDGGDDGTGTTGGEPER